MDTDQLCTNCNAIGTPIGAKVWCKNCREPLCQRCESYHKVQKISKTHIMVPITEISEKITDLLFDDAMCELHCNKPIEVFCMNHNALCCVICLAAEHRSCHEIKDLDHMSEKMKEGKTLQCFLKYLDIVHEQATHSLIQKKNSISCIKKKREDYQQLLETSIVKAKKELDDFKEKCLGELQGKCKGAIINLEDKSTQIQRFIKTLENSRKIIQATSERSTGDQIFVTFESMKTQIKTHLKQLKKELTPEQEIEVIMDFNPTFLSINHVCSEAIIPKLQTIELQIGIQNADFGPLLAGVNPRWYQTPNLKWSKSVYDEFLFGSRLSGDTFLPDAGSLLLMADRARENLVVVDYEDDDVKLTCLPCESIQDVCVSNKAREFYVLNQKQIKVLKVKDFESTIKVKDTFSIDFVAWSIANSGNNLLVSSKSAIRYYSYDKKYMHNIQRAAKCEGSCIAVSEKTKRVYITEQKKLVCRDEKGEPIFVFTDDELGSLKGVAVDADENVYVCGKKSIIQISSDGNTCRTLLTFDKNQEPCSIGFHQDGHTFFVGFEAFGGLFSIYEFE